MNWNEAIALLHGADWKHAKIGLDRMKALMNALGNPQQTLKFIHIAGTNGKGSACSMIRSILTEAGLKTGLYISPHLFSFNERISVDGTDISDDDLIRLSGRIKAAVTDLNEEPTDFELITAMALCYFHEKACDFVVLEVGMGGRLDATNIIDAPEVAAIMSIGLDHTEVLGGTEELIAQEKAGIIKKGSDVVLLHQKPSVMEVISEIFRNVNSDTQGHAAITEPSSLSIHSGTSGFFSKDGNVIVSEPPSLSVHSGTSSFFSKGGNVIVSEPSSLSVHSGTSGFFSKGGNVIITDPSSLSVHSRDLSGQVFDYRDFKNIRLCLLGAYQTENASVVLEIVSCLRARGYKISDEAVRAGLIKAKWPGRFEPLSSDPVFIVDGAHNPDGVRALINSIRTFLPGKKICFVMGVMKDKDYHEMLRLITPFAESFVTELPYSTRGLDPKVLKKEISVYFSGSVDVADSVTEAADKAWAHAKKTNTPVICFGSLYQVADIRSHIRKRTRLTH